MDSIVEGTLYAWARTGTGDWLAAVSFSIPPAKKWDGSTSIGSGALPPQSHPSHDRHHHHHRSGHPTDGRSPTIDTHHRSSTGETVNIGDRYHPAPGAPGIDVVRDSQDAGLVLVENETPGPGVYPYLVKPDTLVPATN